MRIEYSKYNLINLLTLFLIISILQCVPDAPHSNPLDPIYKDSNKGGLEITGYIFRKNVPTFPIDNCLILLIPGQRYTLSDPTGWFSFKNITKGSYQIVLSKPGYQDDTTSIQTDTLTSEPLSYYLNGLPSIKNIHLNSQFIDQWWPDPFWSVTIKLTADDPDGPNDIQEILFQIPELNIMDTLERTSQIDSFYLRLLEPDFPLANIFSVIGKEIFVEIMDRSQAKIVEGPFFIHRIIETSPIPLNPTGLAIVSSQPVLTWQSYPSNFDFDFEIQVFFIVAGIPTLIHTQTQIPASENQYSYPEILGPGQYYWVIIVRDQLGNMSRSKEATFQVQ